MRLAKRLVRLAAGPAAAGALALAGLLLVMWLLHKQPVTLPTPAGPYAVGRVEYDWVDQSRAETFGLGRGGQRELDVWVWYPAAPAAPSQRNARAVSARGVARGARAATAARLPGTIDYT